MHASLGTPLGQRHPSWGIAVSPLLTEPPSPHLQVFDSPARARSSYRPGEASAVQRRATMLTLRRASRPLVMRPCLVCGQRVRGVALCAHHAGGAADGWAANNRIMCDFVHRGIAPPRLRPADDVSAG